MHFQAWRDLLRDPDQGVGYLFYGSQEGSERAFPEQGKGKVKNVGQQARQDRVV